MINTENTTHYDELSGLIPVSELEELAALDEVSGGTPTTPVCASSAPCATLVTGSLTSGLCPTSSCTKSC